MPFNTIDDALRKIFNTRKQTPATRDILRAKDCEWVLSKYAGESFTNYFISQLSIEKWNFSYFIMVKWGFHFTRCTDAHRLLQWDPKSISLMLAMICVNKKYTQTARIIFWAGKSSGENAIPFFSFFFSSLAGRRWCRMSGRLTQI